MARVAYITDIEGRWNKLESFCEGNPSVTLKAGRLEVAPGAIFVFGGDAVDRGPEGRKLIRTLLSVKKRQPDQVVLLAGNRDINKLRLRKELQGDPPTRTPEAERKAGGAQLLQWIFTNTMGAKEAFMHRKTELLNMGEDNSDDAIVHSFIADVASGGDMLEYLKCCQLAFRHDETLFVHGGVTEENFGMVPTGAISPTIGAEFYEDRHSLLESWISALNQFYHSQIMAFENRQMLNETTSGWAAIVAYQAPRPGEKLNQYSVVYARPTDTLGNPSLPERSIVERLQKAGISRLVVGHTPSGDCPAVLRHEGFELIMGDNSYGRIEPGSRILIESERTEISGLTKLDDGLVEQVECSSKISDRSALGYRLGAHGHLLKSTLITGEYLSFKAFEGFRVEQQRCPVTHIETNHLVPAW